MATSRRRTAAWVAASTVAVLIVLLVVVVPPLMERSRALDCLAAKHPEMVDALASAREHDPKAAADVQRQWNSLAMDTEDGRGFIRLIGEPASLSGDLVCDLASRYVRRAWSATA